MHTVLFQRFDESWFPVLSNRLQRGSVGPRSSQCYLGDSLAGLVLNLLLDALEAGSHRVQETNHLPGCTLDPLLQRIEEITPKRIDLLTHGGF